MFEQEKESYRRKEMFFNMNHHLFQQQNQSEQAIHALNPHHHNHHHHHQSHLHQQRQQHELMIMYWLKQHQQQLMTNRPDEFSPAQLLLDFSKSSSHLATAPTVGESASPAPIPFVSRNEKLELDQARVPAEEHMNNNNQPRKILKPHPKFRKVSEILNILGLFEK
jgi:hypothetical protein